MHRGSELAVLRLDLLNLRIDERRAEVRSPRPGPSDVPPLLTVAEPIVFPAVLTPGVRRIPVFRDALHQLLQEVLEALSVLDRDVTLVDRIARRHTLDLDGVIGPETDHHGTPLVHHVLDLIREMGLLLGNRRALLTRTGLIIIARRMVDRNSAIHET